MIKAEVEGEEWTDSDTLEDKILRLIVWYQQDRDINQDLITIEEAYLQEDQEYKQEYDRLEE